MLKRIAAKMWALQDVRKCVVITIVRRFFNLLDENNNNSHIFEQCLTQSLNLNIVNNKTNNEFAVCLDSLNSNF